MLYTGHAISLLYINDNCVHLDDVNSISTMWTTNYELINKQLFQTSEHIYLYVSYIYTNRYVTAAVLLYRTLIIN